MFIQGLLILAERSDWQPEAAQEKRRVGCGRLRREWKTLIFCSCLLDLSLDYM
jgi:hypothetical protein